MIKEFFLRRLLKSQMKGLPAQGLPGQGATDEQIDQMVEMFSKNPELFKKIAEETKELVEKNGMGQVDAAMKIAEKYRSELEGLNKK